ncbi:flagellar protein FlaG [Motiliproteus sp. MSK22-1]|uniref:flagellar protein FlaG n=1 Tax=Motiliproteus sp. MSK22-1 TaxID=1897630 RepID=UPI0009769AC5|nr:flagellar protein FlaG [Motiliproteus sp. MSK22-1]OMH30013.1 hypothetical protein BGP75_18970 [Motiliproteus sp. MSK22-1]
MAENINVSAVPPQGQTASQSASRHVATSEAQGAAIAQEVSDASRTEQPAPTVEELRATISQLNEFMKEGQRSLAFSVDDSSDEVVVRVVDTDTQEVIRQIPNEETLKLKQHIEGMLGLLLSDKA